MKKIILFVFISSIMCGFVFAQTPFPELDKVKQIKLLESTRKDVKRILAEYEDDNDDGCGVCSKTVTKTIVIK